MYEKPLDRLKEALHPRKRKYHKEFHALHNLSFTINRGDCVGIIGKNGAGKSTLLKIITGVLSPTSGTMTVNGKVSALLELGAGFNPELSGIDNVYFNGMILGLSKQEIDHKIDEILDFADIGEHVYQPVKTYSSGMFVRLAFAVAVSIEPEILIVDEALAVGDVRFRQKALRKMKEQMEKAKAILFVTHDMESIKNFCNRVIWIRDGSVYEEGDPKDVIQRYYNFMTHDIEPVKKAAILEDHEETFVNGVTWKELVASELVGGESVKFNKIALLIDGKPDTTNIIQGNEELEFFFEVSIFEDIYEPLLGIGLFNQYGVPVVHFNTSNTKGNKLRTLSRGEKVVFSVKFQVPRLRTGEYTVSVGLNDGTLENNIIIQHARECYVINAVIGGLQEKQSGLLIIDNAEMKIL
ncbi:hypothetical protein BBD40_18650 [Paenibacillus ihbetae]|uniref:ABC transporter domain-containing protein n=2 Tax=Paenibacillus ihbetae TaxID=1870820 RepID=A0ABX3K4J5_9BACL|nr:hypothetical protein BBD40_18650 [Paenibacillus ihbetae]